MTYIYIRYCFWYARVPNPPANKDALPSEFMIETVLEHIAKSLNKDPTEVRKLNFYQKGQVIGFILLLLNQTADHMSL